MRYVAIHSVWDGAQLILGETVHEQDKPPIKTGLLDAKGIPLYRVPDTQPLGFDLRPPRSAD